MKPDLTIAEMKAIAARYPANLCKKDANLDAVVKNIQDGINALKVKGYNDKAETNAKMQELQKNIENIPTDFKRVQVEMQKQFDELARSIKQNPVYSIGGFNDARTFKGAIRENADRFRKLKNDGPAFTIKVNPNSFFTKTAGNVTETGSLTGDVIAPLRLDDIYRDPLRPVHLRQFMNMGRMSSNQVLYNKLSEETDGSGTTAEGSTAGQSDFAITATEVPARKINTYLNISKEMMEDADFIMSYLQTQVVGRILMQEDTQVLSGNGSSPNLQGIIPVAKAYTLGVITGTNSSDINYYDVLINAVTQARVSYYVPNYIIVHPNDYQTVLTARDQYGRYQFEQNIAAGQNGFFIGGALLAPNTAMTQGTFLVGDFSLGAQLFQRDDLEITFSTQNASNFVQGLVTVLVEERLANVVYRPNAFIYGSSFNNAIVSGS